VNGGKSELENKEDEWMLIGRTTMKGMKGGEQTGNSGQGLPGFQDRLDQCS